MTDFASYVAEHRDRFVDELKEFLRIPSISTTPDRADDVDRCADWLAESLTEAGLDSAEVVRTSGHPIVLAEKIVDPSAPTLLVYGHYDVQPSEPDELWTTPPFEPTIRDGRIYARGSVDDKGQVYMHVKAIEARLRNGAGLPVNVKLAIEGEEEVGSKHLESFLAENRERLACDTIVISDTSMYSPDLPCITVGLRGIAYIEIRVTGPTKDLHSGSYGGAVANPANALAGILAALKDDDGRVTIPGFYDRVREIADEEREGLRRLPVDESAIQADVGAPELIGEAGFTMLERLWYRPTLDVNGLLSGFTGEGAKTVLPSYAMAKVSMRLVPDQNSREITRLALEHIEALAPPGVTVEIIDHHGGEPWVAETEGAIYDAAKAALRAGFGAEPVFIREGGSIPIVSLFEEIFQAPVLLLGFGLPGSNPHAPDEWLNLEVYEKGIAALADLYDEIAARPPAG